MTIKEKLEKMSSDEQMDYLMFEMTQQEFSQLIAVRFRDKKFSFNRIQPERSKREDNELL